MSPSDYALTPEEQPVKVKVTRLSRTCTDELADIVDRAPESYRDVTLTQTTISGTADSVMDLASQLEDKDVSVFLNSDRTAHLEEFIVTRMEAARRRWAKRIAKEAGRQARSAVIKDENNTTNTQEATMTTDKMMDALEAFYRYQVRRKDGAAFQDLAKDAQDALLDAGLVLIGFDPVDGPTEALISQVGFGRLVHEFRTDGSRRIYRSVRGGFFLITVTDRYGAGIICATPPVVPTPEPRKEVK
jgi:hypothetical protein